MLRNPVSGINDSLASRYQSINHLLKARPDLVAFLLGLIALTVYIRTLAPNIVFGDGAELTVAAYQLGVAHPTGYPLYTLLGHVFICLYPIGSAAYRMNLLSALSAAGAVSVLYLVGLRIIGRPWFAALCAVLFGFSLTFWSQAVIAEVYTFHLLLINAVLLCVLQWDANGNRSWLHAASLTYGFCFTHHLTSLWLFPALLYFILSSPRRFQFLGELRCLIPLFLTPLLFYLYLPWAAWRDPPENWGDPRTWANFLAHITGRQYRGVMGARTFSQLWHGIVDYAGRPGLTNHGYLLTEFSMGTLWLAPLGLGYLFRHKRRLFGLTLLGYLMPVFWALNYGIDDIYVYYLLPHMIVTLWIGCGLRYLIVILNHLWKRLTISASRRAWLYRGVSAAFLGLPLLFLSGNWVANDLSGQDSALKLGHAYLFPLKPHAIYIVNGDKYAFPVLYSHYVEHLRPDITLIMTADLLYPERFRLIDRLKLEGLVVRTPAPSGQGGAYSIELFRRLIEDNLANRPIYLAGDIVPNLKKFPSLDAAIPGYIRVAGGEPLIEICRSKQTK